MTYTPRTNCTLIVIAKVHRNHFLTKSRTDKKLLILSSLEHIQKLINMLFSYRFTKLRQNWFHMKNTNKMCTPALVLLNYILIYCTLFIPYYMVLLQVRVLQKLRTIGLPFCKTLNQCGSLFDETMTKATAALIA